jgi:hypothetical protein
MKRAFLTVAFIACAATASAQIQTITTTRSGSAGTSSFSIGPRLSNYSTHVDAGPAPLKTGRQSSFGVIGDFRTGKFVLDFSFDHDPENGIRLSDIIVDTGNYARDRGEGTIGYAVTPVLDVQGGIRFDTIRIGGASFFGTPFLSHLDIDHQAVTAGIRLHSDDMTAPIGFYVLGRAYLGSAQFKVAGPNVSTDSFGYRGEGGLNIHIGESNWWVVPGLEFEHLETDDFDIRLNTNRLFLSFVYRSRM